ncbi:MAG: hypothetical protein KAV00_01905 [Phycisphaerae bacterium]|nr:hypothetical protein [Phycisphaerae bacterium]
MRLLSVLLLCAYGCTTTPQPVCYECPQRLMRQWQFTYCMTGPYPWMVEATAEWCRWCCGEPVDVQATVQRLARLALPVPCRVFDTDGDDDVDLRDFQEVQNGDIYRQDC